MDKLTGIVRANAIKNENGRKELKSIMDANKAELKSAVRDAVKKGENRMAAAEKHLTDLNTKTKAALNMKITTQISALAKRANDQIEGLRLSSKEARSEMRKELLYAVRSMADEAKTNLDDAVAVAEKKFEAVNAAEAGAASKSAADRAEIAKSIEAEKANAEQALTDGVATMHRTLLALKYQTEEKIKKTNTRVDAYAEAIKKEASDVSELMAAQMATLNGKIAAQKKAAASAISGADAASAAGFAAALNTVEERLAAAEKAADDKFGKVFVDIADQRAALDNKLGAAVNGINDAIAKQAALADSRFSKTVKDIAGARTEAANQVKGARQDFATGLATITSTIKEMDTRLKGEVMVVSGELADHKAVQNSVNRHVNAEIARVEKLMDSRFSVSERSRGKLRNILNENKRAAAQEVMDLNNLFRTKITKIRSESAHDAESAKRDLTEATEIMYEKMAEAQKEQIYANEESASKINEYSAASMAAIAASKADFEDRLDTLTNTVAANHKSVEHGFEVLTGVIRDYKTADEHDRQLIKDQNAAMGADMQKAITAAIQQGEARAKGVQSAARSHLAGAKKSLLIEITNTVEETADRLFQTIQGKHQKIADNYLSLKAYAVTAEEKLAEFVAQGKGKNLSSLGDLLVNIASLGGVKAQPAEGLSPATELPQVFGSGKVKVDNKVNKINGLVNEFVVTTNSCRERWPMGLGKYLLLKLQSSMKDKGVLQVDKIAEKSGNFVYLNGHAVGLSNKLNDFEGLAVRMAKYEATLAKITSSLSGKPMKPAKLVYAAPPEYQGD